jgi:alkylation response protein AidB-like acyl-CoA dehydrogenase
MTDYTAPIRDMRFILTELADLDRVTALPGHGEVGPELVDAILEEAAKFARDELGPLNHAGDVQPPVLADGTVTTAPGFREAYANFVAGGWNALSCDPAYGGQGMPRLVACAVEEMWQSANMAFGLCPLLTRGAIEALQLCGTDAQKDMYLPKMVEGSWTGTMNLTESQAGSDLSAVRTRAVPEGDHYRISGTKIYITYGEHDYTDNIIHLVLARLPDAPEGVKGISLFVVPKFLVNPDGSPDGRLGVRNDVRCVSLEHKLGIHASPTAMLAFGDAGGAIGTLVGEPNRGIEYMFIMMNAARFAVGLQGVAIGERAYQQALDYARGRIQGAEAGMRGGGKVAILRHPDVRRMLMSMKAATEAARALAYTTAAALDIAAGHPDPATRDRFQARAELLIPVIKGWSTENAIEIASTGVQVHGGMGFIEETGAAQHLRDARILTIYEGTTGIQANDLLGRKIARDKGEAARAAIAEMQATVAELGAIAGEDFSAIHAALKAGAEQLARAVDWAVATYPAEPAVALAGAVPLLKLFGTVAGGWQMGRAALAARKLLDGGDNEDRDFLTAKIGTARFYADHVLSQAHGLAHAAMHGAAGVLALDEAQFAA